MLQVPNLGVCEPIERDEQRHNRGSPSSATARTGMSSLHGVHGATHHALQQRAQPVLYLQNHP